MSLFRRLTEYSPIIDEVLPPSLHRPHPLQYHRSCFDTAKVGHHIGCMNSQNKRHDEEHKM